MLSTFPTDEDVDQMSRVSYSSVVDSMMYAVTCSISQAMSVLSWYMKNSAMTHSQAMNWIIRYLNALDVGQIYDHGRGTSHVLLDMLVLIMLIILRKESLISYVCTLFGSVISQKATLKSTVA